MPGSPEQLRATAGPPGKTAAQLRAALGSSGPPPGKCRVLSYYEALKPSELPGGPDEARRKPSGPEEMHLLRAALGSSGELRAAPPGCPEIIEINAGHRRAFAEVSTLLLNL